MKHRVHFKDPDAPVLYVGDKVEYLGQEWIVFSGMTSGLGVHLRQPGQKPQKLNVPWKHLGTV